MAQIRENGWDGFFTSARLLAAGDGNLAEASPFVCSKRTFARIADSSPALSGLRTNARFIAQMGSARE
jgi:hypothetical protein